MADLLWFLVATLASARITRLVVSDTLVDGARHAFLQRVAHSGRQRAQARSGQSIAPPTPVRQWFLSLLTCPWCIGFWITTATVTLLYLASGISVFGPWWVDLPALSLSAGYMVGWLADQEAT